MSATPAQPKLLQSARFLVEMDNVAVALFQEISGLNTQVVTQEFVEGGNNDYVHILPGPIKYGNITLKRGLSDNRQFFEWRPTMAGGKIVIKRKNLSIKLFTHKGETLKQWDVTDAYPVKWTGPDLRASSMDIVIESIELAHTGWTEVK